MTAQPPRKTVPGRVLLDIFLMQLGRCPLCKERLEIGQKRIIEHMVPRALGGSDNAENLRIVHKECAGLKTRGCEGESKKGSVANGDTHRIAKAARIASGGKVVRHPMPKTGRKIQAHVNPWGKRT